MYYILGVSLSIAIVLSPASNIFIIVLRNENQLSNKTYFAFIPKRIAFFNIEIVESGKVFKAFSLRLKPVLLLSIAVVAVFMSALGFDELTG